jgi:hypothetical protein
MKPAPNKDKMPTIITPAAIAPIIIFLFTNQIRVFFYIKMPLNPSDENSSISFKQITIYNQIENLVSYRNHYCTNIESAKLLCNRTNNDNVL